VLGDGDEVWDEFRHTHIAEVGAAVANRFKIFQAESEAQVLELSCFLQTKPPRTVTHRFALTLTDCPRLRLEFSLCRLSLVH
jgi:hypothetical protein